MTALAAADCGNFGLSNADSICHDQSGGKGYLYRRQQRAELCDHQIDANAVGVHSYGDQNCTAYETHCRGACRARFAARGGRPP